MARVAFGIAGAAIGSFTPLGPSFGWMAGQLLAGVFFPEQLPDVHQQGQRLGDLSVQSSAYGAMVPWHRGTNRLGGNIIWAIPLDEVVTTTTEEQGGKGGPSQTTTTTTYQYFATFAIAYCQGEAAGARRLWMNGELVIDYGIDANSRDIILSNENWKGTFTFYPGSETQTVDSIIEEHEGVGESSAYRGTCFILFYRLDVTANHMIPLIEAEVVFNGSSGSLEKYYDGTATVGNGNAVTALVANRGELWYTDIDYASGAGQDRIAILDLATGTYSYILLESPWHTFGPPADGILMHVAPLLDRAYVNVRAGTNDPWTCLVYSISARQFLMSCAVKFPDSVYFSIVMGVNEERANVLMFEQSAGYARLSVVTLQEGLPDVILASVSHANPGAGVEAIPDADGNYWFPYAVLAEFKRISPEGVITAFNYGADQCDTGKLARDPTRNCIYYWSELGTGNEFLKKLDCSTGAVSRLNAVAYADPIARGQLIYAEDMDRIISVTGSATFRVINPIDGTIEETYTTTASGGKFFGTSLAYSSRIIWGGAEGWVGGAKGIGEFRLSALSESPPTHASVASDLFAEAGYQPGDINVTALAGQTVPGYTIARLGTFRQALEPLMQRYHNDYVESDGKIKAVLRGGSSVVTLTEVDLGAAPFGTKSAPTIKAVRRQELDLPREVRVTYPDKNSNYQVGVQYERMLGGQFKEIQEFTSTIVGTASDSKQMSARLLYSAHTARFQIQFQTSIKYAYLEPTDLVTLVRGNVSYLVRILEKRISGNVIFWTAETDDPTIYSQTGVGAAVAYSISGVQGRGIAVLYLLDIPLLREQDDSTGMYAVAVGTTDGWRGAELHKANDGVNYSNTGVVFPPNTTVGNAATALGDFTGGNRFDYTNRLTVSLYPGSSDLVSVSRTDVFNGLNHALLGHEIIAFKSATLVSPKIYALEGFLRGRAGTAQYISTHVTGERFVLLNPSGIRDIQLIASDINTTRSYKAVTIGTTLPDTPAVSNVFQNIRQKCLPPVKLRGNRNAANSDILISCTRQTRYSPNWRDFADVPIGEPTEKYDLEIWNSTFTLLKRTYANITTPSQLYTAADQTTDFGGVQSTVYCRFYQKNDYGRGYVLQGSVI